MFKTNAHFDIPAIPASSLSEVENEFFISPTLLRVIRVFRVGRVLRLVKSAKGIRTLLFSLAVSLPALFNIGLLLGLVMFIYAIMGMNFFQAANQVYGLDDAFNFDTFLRSFILLFQMCTSAGWSDVLSALISECPAKGSCLWYTKATLYLASYLIISFLVVVNMYIAVILENFSQATEDVQQGLTPDDFDMYYEKWEKYDPKATKYIPLDQLSDFVDYLEDPLRLPKPNHFILVKLDIPICDGDRCYCRDILDALTKNFLGTSETGDVPLKESDKESEEYKPISSTLRRQKEHYAARIIQKAYRNFKDGEDSEDGKDYDEEDGGSGKSGDGKDGSEGSDKNGDGKDGNGRGDDGPNGGNGGNNGHGGGGGNTNGGNDSNKSNGPGDQGNGGNAKLPSSTADESNSGKLNGAGGGLRHHNGSLGAYANGTNGCLKPVPAATFDKANGGTTVIYMNSCYTDPKPVELGPNSGVVA